MATEMLSLPKNPFTYLWTYKFSQDHIELLFSCIRSRGGWNNNRNCLQLMCALRKLLMRNAITALKNANCVDFTGCSGIIPMFHFRKHRSPPTNTKSKQDAIIDKNEQCGQFNEEGHNEFISNVLFYIAGYIVSKLTNSLPYAECRRSVHPLPKETPVDGHDYTASVFRKTGKASAFVTFVNRGGLQIP